MKMYHLSRLNLDGKILKPRVPKSCISGGLEDTKTKRVCISPSISGCYRAINTCGFWYEIMFVHVVENFQELMDNGYIIKPTKNQVIDVNRSNEYWALAPVKLKCIGKISIGYKNRPPSLENKKAYNEYINEYKNHVHFRYLKKYENDIDNNLYERLLNKISNAIKNTLNENSNLIDFGNNKILKSEYIDVPKNFSFAYKKNIGHALTWITVPLLSHTIEDAILEVTESLNSLLFLCGDLSGGEFRIIDSNSSDSVLNPKAICKLEFIRFKGMGGYYSSEIAKDPKNWIIL